MRTHQDSCGLASVGASSMPLLRCWLRARACVARTRHALACVNATEDTRIVAAPPCHTLGRDVLGYSRDFGDLDSHARIDSAPIAWVLMPAHHGPFCACHRCAACAGWACGHGALPVKRQR